MCDHSKLNNIKKWHSQPLQSGISIDQIPPGSHIAVLVSPPSGNTYPTWQVTVTWYPTSRWALSALAYWNSWISGHDVSKSSGGGGRVLVSGSAGKISASKII